MFERFRADVRHTVLRAIGEEAPALGARTVEAEHLLLALAAAGGLPGQFLEQRGLGPQALREALERETAHSLAAVGIDLADFTLEPRRLRSPRTPKLGASAKRALERSAKLAIARNDRRINSAHLLVAILRAEHGSVPRALSVGGVDRIALLSEAEELLG